MIPPNKQSDNSFCFVIEEYEIVLDFFKKDNYYILNILHKDRNISEIKFKKHIDSAYLSFVKCVFNQNVQGRLDVEKEIEFTLIFDGTILNFNGSTNGFQNVTLKIRKAKSPLVHLYIYHNYSIVVDKIIEDYNF